MYNLFNQHDEQIIENFEIIFDRAKNEKTAIANALDYYLSLLDEGQNIDIQEIMEVAENYGWDISSIKNDIKEYEQSKH